MTLLTVHFMDYGQDFLEFDISCGRIVASRPKADGAWRHFQVVTPMDQIKPGIRLDLRSGTLAQAPVLTIKHPIIRVEHAPMM